MSRIRTLLFDFDGTLMDSTQIIVQSWQQVYKKVTGKETELETILSTFGSILGDAIADAFPDEPTDELIKIYRDHNQEHFLEMIDLYPGIEKMLTELKRSGITMALVTSRLKRTTMQAVGKFGLDRYFDVVITANDCTKHKPDPEPILVALEKLNELKARSCTEETDKKVIDPDTVMMVGDTIYDRECARRAGVKCALVAWAPSVDVHSLRESDRPEYLIEKPEDLPEIVKGSASSEKR